MIIQICGSWRPQSNSKWYKIAYDLGQSLTKAGHSILTGAYSGVMEAATKGSADTGGKPIGVTCPEIDAILEPNAWIKQIIKAESLPARLCKCLEIADAIIFLPGRAGTASELALAAELRNKGLLDKPLILYTDFWAGYFKWFEGVAQNLDMPADDCQPKSHVVVSTIEEAVAIIEGPID